MKTKVEHYLYTLNTSNDIGKPVLSDVVRFPQDVLTMFNKQNNFSKEDDSQESVSELINNCFKDLQVTFFYPFLKDFLPTVLDFLNNYGVRIPAKEQAGAVADVRRHLYFHRWLMNGAGASL